MKFRNHGLDSSGDISYETPGWYGKLEYLLGNSCQPASNNHSFPFSFSMDCVYGEYLSLLLREGKN